ncbi:acyltransferase [Arthrobacter sp. NPDC057259]|uniref:acyltransferase family protein n=1 Tax=Arthrobacter sp. NPDC057259 TaxID=3346073 RepID=UPI00363BF153
MTGGSGQRGTGTRSTDGRDPAIDLARLFCLALVVVGHTLMVSPVLHPDGTVTSENTLGNEHWFEPVVWVLQVMPLFFVAGGVTGLYSWRRLRSLGGTASEFIQARLLRLIRPAAVLLAMMFTGLWVARLAGVDPQVVQLLASGAGMPLWFLAAYLAAQLNLPWLAALHARAPWLTLAGLVALVAAVDCLHGAVPGLAYANMVFLWCAVQQLGFLLADGTLRLGLAALLGLVAGSNAVLGAVVVLRLYSGNMLVNLNPPNLTLFLLAVSQAAALQLLRPWLVRLAALRPVGAVLAGVGRRSMTIYLWHLPLIAAVSGLLLLTRLALPAGGSAAWWWTRPLLLLAVALLLLPVLALFGRLEERPTAPGPPRSRPATAVATAAVVVFLPVVQAAVNGLTVGLLGGGAACFALAVLLLGRVPVRAPAPDRPDAGDPLPPPEIHAKVEP